MEFIDQRCLAVTTRRKRQYSLFPYPYYFPGPAPDPRRNKSRTPSRSQLLKPSTSRRLILPSKSCGIVLYFKNSISLFHRLLPFSRAAISISHNPEFHSRMKHIDIAHHFLRDLISQRTINTTLATTWRIYSLKVFLGTYTKISLLELEFCPRPAVY